MGSRCHGARRFNYLSWNRGRRELDKAYMNPEVTVRSRGVMEKCTYCVQRIERARIHARIERRRIREAEVHTACQQACPTEAIVFGDLSNEDAEVARWHRDERHSQVLAQLGTQPRAAGVCPAQAGRVMSYEWMTGSPPSPHNFQEVPSYPHGPHEYSVPEEPEYVR